MFLVMARTVLRRQRDGTYVIRRAGRWRCAWFPIGEAFVLLPLALSFAFVRRMMVLALPMLAIGLGVWILLAKLDTLDERGVAHSWGAMPVKGPGRVVLLHPPRASGEAVRRRP